MLLIGLLLTMWEFSRLRKRQLQKSGRDERVSGRAVHAARDKAAEYLHF
jgi:hypothetical protein